MPEKSFVDSVLTAASQGAAGAIIGALLASVTDPITNRLLVKRMTLAQALADVEITQCITYFQTTLPTNFIKFPLFEVLNELVKNMEIPDSMRGVVTGTIFTTATLPITNYRFCKSIGLEISMFSPDLWKAYFPTVVRDIVYANARNYLSAEISRSFPDSQKSTSGRVASMFMTVVGACLISSPGNEWRGYVLQPAEKRKSPSEFFQLERYLRSTIIGAVVMGLSLGIATIVGPTVQDLLPKLKDRKFLLAALAVGIALKLREKKNE